MDSEAAILLLNAERKMELLKDLDRPISKGSPLAEALVQPPRLPPKLKEEVKPYAQKQIRAKSTSKDYWKNVESPAANVFGEHNIPSEERVVEILPGRAWVVPKILTPEECKTVAAAGEEFGLQHVLKATGSTGLRTNRRTGNFCAPELSHMINPRLPEELLELMEQTRPGTEFVGIHPNWRIAKYDTGEYFSAHYDQADSLTVKNKKSPSGKSRFDSFQTLLISLSDRKDFVGGATRLFPSGDYDESAIDVELPAGWALVFDHRLLHAGLPPSAGSKYIAQAGLLRGEPSGLIGPLSTFKYGPGLQFA